MEQPTPLKRRLRFRPDPFAHGGELNVVPFLDIITNLVMFMLQASAFALSLGELNPKLPTLGDGSGENVPAPLSISVETSGFTVLVPGVEDVVRIPSVDGKLDYLSLTRAAEGYKRQHPTELRVVVIPANETPVDDLVATLDAVRLSGAGPLFPNVMFGSLH